MSTLTETAVPPHIYLQKSKLTPSLLTLCNNLVTYVQMLSGRILSDLSVKLLQYGNPLSIIDGMKGSLDSAAAQFLSLNTRDTSPNTSTKETFVTPRLLRSSLTDILPGINDQSFIPYKEAGSSTAAFDFLNDQHQQQPQPSSSSSSANTVQKMEDSYKDLFRVIFSTVAKEVDDITFTNIISDIERSINSTTSTSPLTMEVDADDDDERTVVMAHFGEILKGELNSLVAFTKVLKRSVIPALREGELGDRVRLLLSTYASISRLNNYLRVGMSNSTSTDLSHLKPITDTVHIEDTLVYNMHPLFVLAFPSNCSALLQEEQSNMDLMTEVRKSLTDLLESFQLSTHEQGCEGHVRCRWR